MPAQLTAVATRQLRAILSYVATENPAAASRIAARIEELRMLLGDNPNMGYKLPHGRLRRFPLRPYPYLIYFEVTKGEARIVRIRHAARYRPAFHERRRPFIR